LNIPAKEWKAGTAAKARGPGWFQRRRRRRTPLLTREFIAMKDSKGDPVRPDSGQDQTDAEFHEGHDGISSRLRFNGSVSPGGGKDLSDLMTEYYKRRERAVQVIESANLLPAKERRDWRNSVDRMTLILEGTEAKFDALLRGIDIYVEGVKRPPLLLGNPVTGTHLLQKDQIECIASAIRTLKETFSRFQRELNTP
jgi:hypothetical protein